MKPVELVGAQGAGWPLPGGGIPSGLAGDIRAAVLNLLPDFPGLAGLAVARVEPLAAFAPPAGRYRLAWPGGGVFVRVTTRLGRPDLEQVISAFVRAAGTPANPLLAHGRFDWQGERFRLDVQPLLAGRAFAGGREDLRRLGAALGLAHRALRDFPRAGEILAAAAARNRRLGVRLAEIRFACSRHDFSAFAGLGEWAEGHSAWLAQAAARLDPGLHLRPGAQVLHGEVHPGNVVFAPGPDGGDAAWLVDWEECRHMYAPPAWDLAWLVQRFALADQPGREELDRRLAAVQEGYGAPLPGLRDLAGAMRDIAGFSVAVLFDWLKDGLLSPASELDKFLALDLQAQQFEAAGGV